MSSIRVASLSLVLCLGLSACMQGTDGTRPVPTSAQSGGAVTERDVEAPDIFSKRDKGLWDGRPSLGGVWVAHPDVKAPERVIIRNSDTGRETIGALFRRERNNPGPVFQVSAEAADAVGMLAGAPTALEVIALRTEEVEIAPEAGADPAPESQQPAQPDPATAPTADVAAPDAPDTPTPQQATPADISAPDADPDAGSPIAGPESDAPRRGGFFSRLFKRGDRPEAEITSTPLDATEPQPAAPGAPPPMPTPVGGNAPAAPAASSLDRPYVQIGIFSVETNATGAARSMRNAGLSAQVKPGSTQGNRFWRVVVGPAATAADRSTMLAQVKKLGFADAYAVRR